MTEARSEMTVGARCMQARVASCRCERHGTLKLFETSRRVLVQQARNQRLIRQALGERSLLDRLQVLTREPDVQPPILAKGCLRVAGVPGALALATFGGLLFAAIDGIKQLLLVSIKLHRPTPRPSTASWPSDSG